MGEPGRRRSGRRPIASAFAIVLVAVLFLLAPPPRPSDNPRVTLSYVALTPHMGFVLGWDANRFMLLAREPWRLLEPREQRQSRPLYVATAAFLRLFVAPFEPERTRHVVREPAWVVYVAMNFVVLLLAVLAFQALFPDSAWPLGIFMTSLLLVANDVVKAFFWTPHTHMFNMLVPAATMVCCRRLYLNPAIRPRALLLLGLGGGTLTLYYGSFTVLLPAAIAALSFGRARATTARPSLLAQIGALGLGFVAVPLAWIVTVTVLAGEFYSEEITHYRQFVWIFHAWNAGRLERTVARLMSAFMRASAEALWFPFTLAVAAACIGRLGRVRAADVTREHRPTLVAAAITFVCAFAFLGLLGTYAVRLSWSLAPPVLALVAAIGATTRSRLPARDRLLVDVGLVLAVVGWLAYGIAKRGPYI